MTVTSTKILILQESFQLYFPIQVRLCDKLSSMLDEKETNLNIYKSSNRLIYGFICFFDWDKTILGERDKKIYKKTKKKKNPNKIPFK